MVSYARRLISEHGVSEFGHMACPNSDFFFFFFFFFFLFFFFFARVADEFSEVARDARGHAHSTLARSMSLGDV